MLVRDDMFGGCRGGGGLRMGYASGHVHELPTHSLLGGGGEIGTRQGVVVVVVVVIGVV